MARLGNSALLPSDAQLDAMIKEQTSHRAAARCGEGQKESLDREQYYAELEKVLVEMAQLDKRIDARKAVLFGRARCSWRV